MAETTKAPSSIKEVNAALAAKDEQISQLTEMVRDLAGKIDNNVNSRGDMDRIDALEQRLALLGDPVARSQNIGKKSAEVLKRNAEKVLVIKDEKGKIVRYCVTPHEQDKPGAEWIDRPKPNYHLRTRMLDAFSRKRFGDDGFRPIPISFYSEYSLNGHEESLVQNDLFVQKGIRFDAALHRIDPA